MGDEFSDDSLATLLQDGFRYAMSLSHDVSDAEDILQDAWLAVLKANGPHEKPYLFRAIKSRFINQYRRERLVPISSIEADEVGGAEQVTGAEDINLSGVDSAFWESGLSKLRPSEREALFLSVVEGYSAKEISEQTDQPRGSVLSLIHRAKQKLRRSFSREIKEAKQ